MNEVIELTKKELTTKEELVKSYFTALDKCEKINMEGGRDYSQHSE